MIETAVREINLSNRGNRWIADAFGRCGLDPSCRDFARMEAHIAALKACPFYKEIKIVPCNEVLILENAGLID